MLRKPAEQAIEAAIRQQVVAHLNDLRARANCRVVQDAGKEALGWSEYSIKPFGAHAHPNVTLTPEEAMEKGEGFCDGWDGADTTSLVLYNPAITKELFFVYHGLSDPISELPDDIFSLRMSGSTPNGVVGATRVSKLNVRGISVRMSRKEVLDAGKAAGMRVLIDSPVQLKLADPTASGELIGNDRGPGESGLVLVINFKDDRATNVMIKEQGTEHGEVFEDLCKKWGKPPYLPYDYANELGTGNKATWGDKNDVYAEYDPSLTSFSVQSVTIINAKAFPKTAPRKRVQM